MNVKRKYRVSNTIIYTMTNAEPLIHCVRKRQRGFLGYILRLPEEEPARRYTYIYIAFYGTKRPGRTFYLAYIQHVLGCDENEMGVEEIATLPKTGAKDRCAE